MYRLSILQRVEIAGLLYALLFCFNARGTVAVTRFVGRFFFGYPLFTKPKTNATFLKPADRVVHKFGRASKWAHLAGYKRAGYRIQGLTAVSTAGYLYFVHPLILRIAVAVLAAMLLASSLWVMLDRWDTRLLRRNVILPIHRTLWEMVGHYPHVSAGQWVSVPKDYTVNPSAKIVLKLPEDFRGTADERKAIPPVIAAKLGGEWDAEFKLRGNTPQLVMSQAPKPPNTVRIADIKDILLAAPEHAPILGIGTHRNVISVDFQSDSPHIALSMGSGGGKSVTVRALMMQLARNGAEIDLLDFAKRGVSHLWAKDIPDVSIWRTVETGHNALVRLNKTMEGRYEEIYSDPSQEESFRRHILVFEELNASMRMLKDYWNKIRTKDDPKESPAVEALAALLYAGRQGRINVIAVAQSFTAKAIGGPESRENFAYRILGRYTVNAWKMLAPEVWPAPRSVKHSGRVQVVTGGEAKACQVLFTNDSEARTWALAERTELEPVISTLTVESESPIPIKYTLSRAAKLGLIPVNYEAAKKIRQRNSDFPRGPEYTEEELTQWFANYPASN